MYFFFKLSTYPVIYVSLSFALSVRLLNFDRLYIGRSVLNHSIVNLFGDKRK